MSAYDNWVGRERVEEDVITLATARGMAGLLDRDPDEVEVGSPLPECWHWLYFKPMVRRSHRAPDGHARRGEFIPPIELPGRMWAGGSLRFTGALRVGDAVTRRSTIRAVTEKEGRTGRLVFLTIGHRIDGPRGPAIEEEQQLVYREPPRPGEPTASPPPRPAEPEWSETFLPDAVSLFLFSALTGNGHRIHYDYQYVTLVENYPALVVHGPLTALLLMDAARRRTGRAAIVYTYRGASPLFNEEAITLLGRRLKADQSEVWAEGPGQRVAMRGTVDWRD